MPGKRCEVANCPNPPVWRCEGGFLYCEDHRKAKGVHGFRDQFGKLMYGAHIVWRKLKQSEFPNEVAA